MEDFRDVAEEIIDKQKLIDAICDKTSIQSGLVATVIETLLKTVSTSIASGRQVKLDGIGTFATECRKHREGRNPRTGEKIVIPNSYVLRFQVDESFRADLQIARSVE